MQKFNVLLNQYLQYQINYLNKSSNSVNSYKYDIEKFFLYLETKKITTLDIEITTANDFVTYLSKNRKLSASSINRLISTLRNFYKFLIGEKQINTNVFNKVKNLNSEYKLPNFISYAEVEKILSYNPNPKHCSRDCLVVGLMFFGGLRISEVNVLKYDDLFLEDDYMIVTGKGSKQRHVFLVKELKDLLLNYIKDNMNPKTYLILNSRKTQMSRQSLWTIVKNKAKVIETKITPHTLRHSFATYLMEKGLSQYDIKELLGHSSITTTEMYVHVTNKQLRKSLSKKIDSINNIIGSDDETN